MCREVTVYLKLSALKTVISSPPIDHHINVQIIQGPLERLYLLAVKRSSEACLVNLTSACTDLQSRVTCLQRVSQFWERTAHHLADPVILVNVPNGEI